MDRELFESLFEIDNKWNDVELDAKIYKGVMSKLYYTLNSNKVQFYQVKGFGKYKTEFIKKDW
ncbi:hypothetical protein V3320_01845 [Mycoplasmopsis agalactiae]|uniref:Uncharacterized protein n=2 Tax=Mycoplasmopsis agalactiae TaxID=2110 RepID=A5IYC7_MYCAP|nr:hypothetical protein [Mycoplasmopsis agalactiae]NLS34364.1 hypothetical protein [Mycoplasmopsis agalactiae]CAL59036.1 Conserved hypothetical protein, potentially truncated inC terminal [Mycoplasmopsis agalactiae PG2]